MSIRTAPLVPEEHRNLQDFQDFVKYLGLAGIS